MDFDSPAAAQKAVASLKASGVQAQMAKVSFNSPCTYSLLLEISFHVVGVFGNPESSGQLWMLIVI